MLFIIQITYGVECDRCAIILYVEIVTACAYDAIFCNELEFYASIIDYIGPTTHVTDDRSVRTSLLNALVKKRKGQSYPLNDAINFVTHRKKKIALYICSTYIDLLYGQMNTIICKANLNIV